MNFISSHVCPFHIILGIVQLFKYCSLPLPLSKKLMPPREHNNMFPLEIYSSLRGLNSIQSLWSEGHQVYTYTNTIYLCSLWNVPPENADHCNYNTTIIFNKWLEDLFNPYWAGRTYMSLPGKGWEGYICPTIVMPCWHHYDII